MVGAATVKWDASAKGQTHQHRQPQTLMPWSGPVTSPLVEKNYGDTDVFMVLINNYN
jgi:hypothetical protein